MKWEVKLTYTLCVEADNANDAKWMALTTLEKSEDHWLKVTLMGLTEKARLLGSKPSGSK